MHRHPPSEAERAFYSYLITRKPTREESRMAVRHLLREASRNLEREPMTGAPFHLASDSQGSMPK